MVMHSLTGPQSVGESHADHPSGRIRPLRVAAETAWPWFCTPSLGEETLLVVLRRLVVAIQTVGQHRHHVDVGLGGRS